MIQPLAQAHQFQRLLGRHGLGSDVGHDGNIFARGEAGNEVIELKDKAHVVAAKAREAGVAGVGQVFAVVPHLPGAGHVQPAQNVQQGRFAAARRPQHDDKFARAQFQIDAAQGMHLDIAHAIHLGQPLCPENQILVVRFRHTAPLLLHCS